MNYLNIEKKTLTKVVDSLNQLLADYQIYYQNLRRYHWHVQGHHFFDLHVKFEELYTSAQSVVDQLAERILTLRFMPMATNMEYLAKSKVKETIAETDQEMVAAILENHKIIIEEMRAVLNNASEADDEGTTDLVGGLLSSLEKSSWMLDAWMAKS